MVSKNSSMPADTKASAKQILNQIKMEAAAEVGVDLKPGYNGDLTSRQAGSVGGQMVNLMSPKQQWNFNRCNRNIIGHSYTVSYKIAVGL